LTAGNKGTFIKGWKPGTLAGVNRKEVRQANPDPVGETQAVVGEGASAYVSNCGVGGGVAPGKTGPR